MGKKPRFHDSIDPDARDFGQRYPRFPGIAEYARLITKGKARGSIAELIVRDIADNAADCLPELIHAYRAGDCDVPLYVMMALDIARPPEAVHFLAEVLKEGREPFVQYAERALRGIDTRESRKALWNAGYCDS